MIVKHTLAFFQRV